MNRNDRINIDEEEEEDIENEKQRQDRPRNGSCEILVVDLSSTSGLNGASATGKGETPHSVPEHDKSKGQATEGYTSTLEQELKESDEGIGTGSYYYSYRDKQSRSSSRYCYFYDDTTSVSTIVSLPNNTFAQKATKTTKTTRSRCRLDELYEQGKERKRTELKQFLERKIAQEYDSLPASNGTIPMKGGDFKDESMPGNCYTKMNALLKKNREIELKRKREIARARAKKTQQELLVRLTSRTRSYGTICDGQLFSPLLA